MAGIFISFEGGEGSGKSTQTTILKNWLVQQCPQREIIITREPGGTDLAEYIRDILVKGHAALTVQTEALLMIAARADHVKKIIAPALKRDAIILCDRFSDSTYVYQGMVDDLSVDMLTTIHKFAFDNITPNITFLMDVPAELGLKRKQKQGYISENITDNEDRFENKGLEFHKRVRDSFLCLAEQEKHRFVIIDASQTEEHSDQQVKAHLLNSQLMSFLKTL